MFKLINMLHKSVLISKTKSVTLSCLNQIYLKFVLEPTRFSFQTYIDFRQNIFSLEL